MAIARALFFGLLILALGLGIVGLLLPSQTHVERSILIEASPAEIFPHLDSLRAFNAWSPWAQEAADTRYEFSGPDNGVGARMRWDSEQAGVGSGTQEIVASEPGRRVVTELNFGEQGQGIATWTLSETGAVTRVDWAFDTEFGWDILGRYAGLFLDGLIGAEYETGLQRLKQLVETGAR